MRETETKFRVWDLKEKRFWNENDKINCSLTIDGLPLFWTGDNIRFVGKFWPKDMWVLQEYTGLIDKNNKEIYEGDILSYKLSYQEFMENGGGGDAVDIDQVIFEYGAFKLKNGDYLYELINMDGTLDDEVIGNIFETPEYLK